MKFVKALIPIALIVVFVFIMNSAYFFHPLIKSVPDLIDGIEECVLNEKWDEASEKAEMLYNDLVECRFPWMQFSIERKEINNLMESLYRLKGSIKIKDAADCMNVLYEMRASWDNLGS